MSHSKKEDEPQTKSTNPSTKSQNLDEMEIIEFTPEYIFENAKKAIQELLDNKKKQNLVGDIKRLFDFSYNQNNELIEQKDNIKQINERLQDTERKLSFMTTFSEDLQDTISQLKAVLEDTWRELDASRTREQNIQDELDNSRNLGKISTKVTDELGQDSGVPDTIDRFKQILLRERDRLSGELKEVERRLVTQRLYAETVGQLCHRLEENNAKLAKDLESCETTELKKNKKIAHLKEQVHDLTKTKINLIRKCDGLEGKINQLQIAIKTTESDMGKLQHSLDKIRLKHSHFQKKMQSVVRNLRLCVQDKNTQDQSVKLLQQIIMTKEFGIHQLTQKLQRMSSDNCRLNALNYKIEKENAVLQQEKQKQTITIQRGERDILAYQKTNQHLEHMKELVTHERDKLRSEIKKLNAQIVDLKHINTLKNNVISNLQMDKARLKNKIDELKHCITKVERERDEQIREVEALNENVDKLAEQIQIKTDYGNQLKLELADKHANLIEVQLILEKTRTDRLVLQNSLQRCSEDRSTLKSLQAKTTQQITQQTEQIVENHNKINHLNIKVDNLEREKHELNAQLYITKQTLNDTKEELKIMHNKNEKLHKDLENDERRFQKVVHQFEETKKYKDLIGLQLVRRNDEISLLRDRLAILETTLNRGHTLYNQRLEDIRLLKLKISKLYTEKEVLYKAVINTTEARKKLAHITRLLNAKEIECKALEEQAKIPINVHRWRILRGSDPDRYTTLVKMRVLQKKIIKLYVEGTHREQAFQTFQKTYDKLKEFIEKIPNKEIKQNLVKTQTIIKERETKLKAVTAELTTKEIDIKLMENKIDELNKIMRAVKQDLIKVKNKDKDTSVKKCLTNIIGKLGKVY